MTVEVYGLYQKRVKELELITLEIMRLKLSEEWKEVFTHLCLYRGWITLKNTQKSQMMNIAAIDSHAVKYLAKQSKKVGLNMLEDLSVKIEDEKVRLKAVQLIINKGVKPSKNELDLIIATAKSTNTLFDVA